MSDLKQRARALDIANSYIVQAPAGAGKTEILVQRYLKLLASSAQPENTLVMTFTNKAADELVERVLLALESTRHPPPKVPHQRQTYDLALRVIQHSDECCWDLLQNPKRLKISTIDGLANLIISRYPLPQQLVPRQIITQQWEQNHAYKQVAMDVVQMVDDAQYGESVATLLLYLDNNVNRFYRLIVKMLGRRDQWLMRLYRDDTIEPDTLKKNAKKIIVAHLGHLRQVAQPYLDAHFFTLLKGNTKAELGSIQNLPKAEIGALAAWQAIADLLLAGGIDKKNEWRKSVNKNQGFTPEIKAQKVQFIKFLKTLERQDKFKNLLFEALCLPDVEFSTTQTKALSVIAQVLKLCVAQLQMYFERKQAHDFIEVALLANQALDARDEVSDIALFLDYQVQHLLIDEFQDISTSQFNSIEKLISQWHQNDGKTLFLVGDPMQSIYRFRESQVGLFLQVRTQGIANIKPIPLVLKTNFRSSQSIVEGNNQFFSAIFPQEDDIYQSAISYSPSISASAATDTEAIVFHPFAHDQIQEEAQTVLKIVQQALASNPDGEVAILARGRGHLSAIASTLKAGKIDFEARKINPLTEHLFTRDLLSLTKALLHLGDKLAWLSVLRAPWCGLILDDLLILSESDTTVIYQQLTDENTLSRLSEDGRIRAQHLHHCLFDAVHNQGRFSFVERLTHALQQLQNTRALSAIEVSIKTQFLHIVHECEWHQLLNPQTLKESLSDLYTPSEKAQVKLMSIHESKGLEFDTVIIPGLGKPPKNYAPPIIQMQEFADQSLLLAPIKASADINESATSRYLKFIESQQNKFEVMRLLYVAMTRAKKHLHLLGALNVSEKVIKSSFLALLIPFYQHRFEQLTVLEVDSDSVPKNAPTLQRLKILQTPINKTKIHNETGTCQQNFEILFKRLLGTLIHFYYEHGLFNPSPENIKIRLIEMGIAPSEIERYCALVIELLDNTKQDPQFDWLFKDRPSTRTEVAFVVDEKTIIIDRLFIDNDVLWIIDFKIATLDQGETLAQFINQQRQQNATQLLSYQAALSKIYDNDIKCALYCPAISQLIEITH